MPSCQKRVFWRVLEQPLEISTRQRELINQMISNARDPMTCQLLTSGTPRQDGSGYVDVNRPLQPYSDTTNKLMHCDKLDFGKQTGIVIFKAYALGSLRDKISPLALISILPSFYL